MPRIRTIKPEFWESESIGRLSRDARLLFLSCLNMADDEGLLRWSEPYLMSSAFPYDDLLTESLTEWMCELVSERLILPYVTGHPKQRLAWIVKFRSHQVINRPSQSKLPGPSIQNQDYRRAIYERDGWVCHICNEPVDKIENTNVVNSLAPSLDHIVPRSKGGSDYPSNLKCAHISCNKSRGNSLIIEPLNDSLNDSVNDSLPEVEVEVEVEGERKGKGKDKTQTPQTPLAGGPEGAGDSEGSKSGKTGDIQNPENIETKETKNVDKEGPRRQTEYAKAILAYLNKIAGREFKEVESNLDSIRQRMKEGATVERCRMVIFDRWEAWGKDDEKREWVNPTTLFRKSNFWRYEGML